MGNTIISAVYGTGKAGIDVTQTCQNIVNTGDDDITASNSVFGTDPDPGATKSFAILYQNPALNNGNPIALGCSEGATIDLVPNPPTANTPKVPVSNFTIVHAMYGTARNGFDVTTICQGQVNAGHTTITVSNDTFGGDPDHGAKKNFAIVYTAVGSTVQHYLAAVEGSTVTLKA